MAVENVFDATTSWVADIDPGPRKILAHRYPGVPNLGDVRDMREYIRDKSPETAQGSTEERKP